ncbi:signal transduction histidine-protein kinase AtoS [Geobacter sp. OR-1]|uniref:two-component system sensor histidine kinase NtrB n=1 Tax=Geobacter sp. OR-1 TaxID=1266765 RepID=UPI0005427EDE|nr:ATP-binding protein [Geobacter sp. OR-1]GAM11481.1 signal transduction histidine-protein kinase AtoS [Geobacter sp. OR-1]
MAEAKRTLVDEPNLERLLGLESSKIGFYSEVKQKIQELEAANLELRIKTGELQAVFDAISDSVVIYDHRGCVQHRNRVSPQLFPTETTIGRCCKTLFHPDRDRSPDCPVELALSGQNAQVSFCLADRMGNDRYFDVTATPIEDANEETRALVFIRNVTDKRLNELQLLQAEKLSSIGLLAAGVAHEINNPLTSVAGYSEALLRRFRDDKALADDPRLRDFKNYLGVIIRESYRCKGIIDSLLSFSRKSEGAVGLVDINEILGEVLELVRHRARNERIEIRELLQLNLPMVKGDASGLRQVFLNLTMNALQSIEGPGMIEIATAEHEDRTVSATISDNGCGISPAMMEQIWDPFFTTKEPGKGIGLGLSVTYNIIKMHGGKVFVESRHGEGSKFTVRLPICQP